MVAIRHPAPPARGCTTPLGWRLKHEAGPRHVLVYMACASGKLPNCSAWLLVHHFLLPRDLAESLRHTPVFPMLDLAYRSTGLFNFPCDVLLAGLCACFGVAVSRPADLVSAANRFVGRYSAMAPSLPFGGKNPRSFRDQSETVIWLPRPMGYRFEPHPADQRRRTATC